MLVLEAASFGPSGCSGTSEESRQKEREEHPQKFNIALISLLTQLVPEPSAPTSTPLQASALLEHFDSTGRFTMPSPKQMYLGCSRLNHKQTEQEKWKR